MRWGTWESKLIAATEERGGELPDVVLNAPRLDWDLEWLWNAYTALSTCRQMGFGSPGPIPWIAVDRYAERNGIHGDDFDLMWLVISRVDVAYLEETARAAKETQGG